MLMSHDNPRSPFDLFRSHACLILNSSAIRESLVYYELESLHKYQHKIVVGEEEAVSLTSFTTS